MSLVKSIERGINSSTYNPEAEKALREDRKQASEARQKYRDALFKMRDKKSQMIQEKNASDFFIKNIDTLVNQQFKWITDNPDAELQTITDQAQMTSEKYQDIFNTNIIALTISVFPKYLRTIAANALLKKQITEDKKKEFDTLADNLDAWLKTAPTLTSEQIVSKKQALELEYKQLLESVGEAMPAVTSPEAAAKLKKETDAKQIKVSKEEEADKNTFKLSRLLTETGRIALKVVGSLFIVMLILVSGMLTANDAIARDPQYRILYFIYGGLGFPFMLLYYVYRWFTGSAPYIYRLLPLYTQETDTSLGRFFLFPFTYKEDQAAKDAKTGFLTAAATLVGKEYTPPAEKTAEQLGSFLEKMQSATLNSTLPKEAVTKGTNVILKGIQELNVTK